MRQGDLFDAPKYPDVPGWKARDTSREAADALLARLPRLKRAVLAAYRKAGKPGLTADEAAAIIGETVLAVRPRVTELALDGYLVDSGFRRRNASRRRAIVWTVT